MSETAFEASDKLFHIQRALDVRQHAPLFGLLLLLLLRRFSQQGIVQGSGLLATVLVDCHTLIGEVSVGSRRAELCRDGRERVSGLGGLESKFEPALFAAGEIAIDQLGSIGAGGSARGRSELRESCRILAVLRIILGLGGVNGRDGFHGGHFLCVGAGFGEFGERHGQDDEDDRDDDQQLYQ